MKCHWRSPSVILLISIGISGCIPVEGRSTEVLPTADVAITTNVPTSSVPSVEPTLQANPTMTYIPPLPIEEAELRMFELLSNNGGCRLPCFLGIVPGETEEQEVISKLHNYQEMYPGPEIEFPQDDFVLSISIVWNTEFISTIEVIRSLQIDMIAYRRINYDSSYVDRRVYGPQRYRDFFQYYTLPNILSVYGRPTQAYVFLDTGIADMGLGIDLYLLILDYSNAGWVAVFEMPLIYRGDQLLGCPDTAITTLRMWSPEDSFMTHTYGFINEDPLLLTIEEATSLTLEEFFQQYKDPANTACLETSTDIYEP